MKPLTKTTANRGGGIAARFAQLSQPDALASSKKNIWTEENLKVTKKPKDRVTRWREANPELYKERQAAYMRKKRAKPKEAKE